MIDICEISSSSRQFSVKGARGVSTGFAKNPWNLLQDIIMFLLDCRPSRTLYFLEFRSSTPLPLFTWTYRFIWSSKVLKCKIFSCHFADYRTLRSLNISPDLISVSSVLIYESSEISINFNNFSIQIFILKVHNLGLDFSGSKIIFQCFKTNINQIHRHQGPKSSLNLGAKLGIVLMLI